jgi:ectoine hydroxylase-related dioxygenase (phytanoyl-CoA dioxygenase family)
MDLNKIKTDLETNGYCIVPNILTKEQIQEYLHDFKTWQQSIPNHDTFHEKYDPNGIYKFQRAGHTRHGWKVRTNKNIQDIFKHLWNTEELVVSFDGCCYISKDSKKKNKNWTHTDQAPNDSTLKCYQGFVSFTDNKEKTFVAWKGTHKLHEEYFKEKGINDNKNWHFIDLDYLEKHKEKRMTLDIPAGSLVIWDSRTFHQNQMGEKNDEERYIQYVSYLPKDGKKNTPAMQKKRLKYLEEQRTTSHWAYPIKVNGLR